MTHLVTARAAKSLAVAYEAYMSAHDNKDDLGVRVWGRALISSQEETGIQLQTPSNVEAMISRAGQRLAASELPLTMGEDA